jgi:hypothetical protein
MHPLLAQSLVVALPGVVCADVLAALWVAFSFFLFLRLFIFLIASSSLRTLQSSNHTHATADVVKTYQQAAPTAYPAESAIGVIEGRQLTDGPSHTAA